jgi:hypothetical protein
VPGQQGEWMLTSWGWGEGTYTRHVCSVWALGRPERAADVTDEFASASHSSKSAYIFDSNPASRKLETGGKK